MKEKRTKQQDSSIAPRAQEETMSGAAERSLWMLSLLSVEGRPLSLDELCERMSLPKLTVQKLCTNLLASGYLIRDVEKHSYSLGPEFWTMTVATVRHSSLHSERHAILKRLSLLIGETCNFTTLDGTEVLYLDRVEFKRPLRLTIDVGSHVPIHCTSSGKLLLANMPVTVRDDLISRMPLTRMTDNTITDPAALLADCKAIIKRGFSIDNEEFVTGLVSIAAPVRDTKNTVRATVSFHAPKERMSLEHAQTHLDLLRGAAEAIGRLMR